MKMKYVKPEMAVECVELETMIATSPGVKTSTENALEMDALSKERFDFDDDASSEDWDGLW